VNDAREALGYEQVILLGGSFGSHWSMAIMRYHPEIVARAILRGLEGPDHTYDMPSEMLEDLERIAATVEAVPELGELIPEGGLLNAYREVIARAAEKPIEAQVEDDDGELRTVRFDLEGVRWMSQGYSGSARSRRSLPGWPAQMLEMIAGDFEGAAREWLDESNGFPTASFFMLDCGSGISEARAERMAADEAIATVGKLGSFYDANCPAWASDLGEEFRENFETEIPTLLVHGDWDLSTPLGNARDLEPFFKKGKLVVIEGGTHGALREAWAESALFREAMTSFIRTGDLDAMPDRIELPPIEWEIPDAEAEAPGSEE
jgi:pimeloyl-ACP methyl ester carboxylesterase